MVGVVGGWWLGGEVDGWVTKLGGWGGGGWLVGWFWVVGGCWVVRWMGLLSGWGGWGGRGGYGWWDRSVVEWWGSFGWLWVGPSRKQKNFWGPVGVLVGGGVVGGVGGGGVGLVGWLVRVLGCGGGWGGPGGGVVRCGPRVDGVWTQTVQAQVENGFRRAPFGEAKITNVLVLFMCGCLHLKPLFDCYCARDSLNLHP